MADENAGGAPSSEPASAPDLDSALDRAFAESGVGGDDREEPDTSGKPSDRDPTGKFKKRDTASDAGKTPPDGKTDPAAKPAPGADPASQAKDGKTDPGKTADTPTGPVEPPQHWSEADKAKFRAIKPEDQGFVMERYKAMEADHTKKTQAIAEERKGFEAVKTYVKPIWDTITEIETEGQKHGFTVEQGIKSLWTTYRQLHQDPTQTILALAKQYGADLTKLGIPDKGAEGDDYIDPQLKVRDDRIAKLEKQISDLTGSVKGREDAEQAALRTEASSEVSKMASAAGGDGQPLYPHFEEVRGRMSQIAAQGFVGSLAELYDEACWQVPTVRSKRVEAETSKAASEAEAKRKAEAEEAEKKRQEAITKARKGGSTTFRSDAPGNGQAKPKSIDEAFDMAAKELGTR